MRAYGDELLSLGGRVGHDGFDPGRGLVGRENEDGRRGQVEVEKKRGRLTACALSLERRERVVLFRRLRAVDLHGSEVV